MTFTKQQIYKASLEEIKGRIALTQKAFDDAVAAGNEETKSSAGDKFETGRAMMQMEQDKLKTQLFKLQQLQIQMEQLDWIKKHNVVSNGALVISEQGAFFIAVGLGKIIVDQESCFVISTEAPIAKAMLGLKEGDIFLFKNMNCAIKEIL